jgi:hypothetical protein
MRRVARNGPSVSEMGLGPAATGPPPMRSSFGGSIGGVHLADVCARATSGYQTNREKPTASDGGHLTVRDLPTFREAYRSGAASCWIAF